MSRGRHTYQSHCIQCGDLIVQTARTAGRIEIVEAAPPIGNRAVCRMPADVDFVGLIDEAIWAELLQYGLAAQIAKLLGIGPVVQIDVQVQLHRWRLPVLIDTCVGRERHFLYKDQIPIAIN